MARAPDARLAAIRSLFRYAALRHLDHAALNARVLAIPPQRFGRTLATFLTVPEISPLLGRNVEGDTIGAVVIRLTALLSFDGISTPSQVAQGEQRRSPNFKAQLSNPQTSSFVSGAPASHSRDRLGSSNLACESAK
jgi:hypothetical protein